MPLIPALGRQKLSDLGEFQSGVQSNSRTARATQGNLKNKTKQNKQNRFTKQVQKTTQEISSKTKA